MPSRNCELSTALRPARDVRGRAERFLGYSELLLLHPTAVLGRESSQSSTNSRLLSSLSLLIITIYDLLLVSTRTAEGRYLPPCSRDQRAGRGGMGEGGWGEGPSSSSASWTTFSSPMYHFVRALKCFKIYPGDSGECRDALEMVGVERQTGVKSTLQYEYKILMR